MPKPLGEYKVFKNGEHIATGTIKEIAEQFGWKPKTTRAYINGWSKVKGYAFEFVYTPATESTANNYPDKWKAWFATEWDSMRKKFGKA